MILITGKGFWQIAGIPCLLFYLKKKRTILIQGHCSFYSGCLYSSKSEIEQFKV